MKSIATILFLCSALLSFAQSSYYISSTDGNNSTNNGLSAGSPWADFNNLDGVTLQPGDTIFIKCGDVIEDSLNLLGTGSSSAPIVITAYGNGAKPIVSGSKKLTSWTGSTIKSCTSFQAVRCLIVNGTQEAYAKSPDTGFFYADNNTSVNGFTDNDLPSTPDYDGAKICVRTSLWTWESTIVSSHNGSNVTFQTPTNQPTTAPDFDGFGYFFFDRADLITVPGEWSWTSPTIQYYPSVGIDPNVDDVQGVILNCGIRINGNSDFIRIEGIEFRNQFDAGIKILNQNSSTIAIHNCTFRNIVQYGVYLSGSDHSISNSTFYDVDGRGIYGVNCLSLEIRNNTIKRTGMFRNYGVHEDDNLTAIAIYGSDQSHIHHNEIDSVGYSGIRCDGSNSLVERNKISNYMMLLSDGGAVKTYGDFSTEITYQNNIIRSGRFNHDGAPTSSEHIQSAALYFDFYVLNSSFLNNVVYDSVETGIFLNGGSDHIHVEGNVIYGGKTQILLNDRFASPDTIYADTIRNNYCFALEETTNSVRINSNNNYNIGYIDENYLVNPYGDNNIGELHGTIGGMPGTSYSFNGWQNALGFDLNSTPTFVSWASNENHSQLFVNDTDTSVTINLGNMIYLDLDSTTYCGSITIPPYYGVILIQTGVTCNVGMNEPELQKLLVYPNPCQETLHILPPTQNNSEPLQLTIINAFGEIAISKQVSNSEILTIDISNLSKGNYVICLSGHDTFYRANFIRL